MRVRPRRGLPVHTAVMELAGTNGGMVALRPIGYEYPIMTDGYDADWLVVEGVVREPDGAEWSFTDPCLTAWEARELLEWLRQVAARRVTARPWQWDDSEDPFTIAERAGLLVFIEPVIAFGISAYGAEAAHVRVHLSLGAAGPDFERLDLFERYVDLELPFATVTRAADSWADDVARYPCRTGQERKSRLRSLTQLVRLRTTGRGNTQPRP